MKRIKFASLIGLSLVMGAMTLTSCGSTNSASSSKQKGIVLQEGDKATLTVDGDYTIIELPKEKTVEDLAFYDTDVLGYLLKSNANITTDGQNWGQ